MNGTATYVVEYMRHLADKIERGEVWVDAMEVHRDTEAYAEDGEDFMRYRYTGLRRLTVKTSGHRT